MRKQRKHFTGLIDCQAGRKELKRTTRILGVQLEVITTWPPKATDVHLLITP